MISASEINRQQHAVRDRLGSDFVYQSGGLRHGTASVHRGTDSCFA